MEIEVQPPPNINIPSLNFLVFTFRRSQQPASAPSAGDASKCADPRAFWIGHESHEHADVFFFLADMFFSA